MNTENFSKKAPKPVNEKEIIKRRAEKKAKAPAPVQPPKPGGN